MELNRNIFITAAVITVFIFISIYSLNLILSDKREETIIAKMEEITDDISETQTISYLMRVYGENVTCIALQKHMSYLDTRIWELGAKIDSYRRITREYMSDPFYIKQKEKFNRQEVMYLSLMKEMKQKCGTDEVIVLYFYGDCDINRQCDEQSFVLTYINEKINPEIAIFSFDMDLGIASVDLLASIYNITELPSVVVEEERYDGFHDRRELEEILCSHGNLSICSIEK